MEDHEREDADLDGLEEDELELSLGLRPAPSRRRLNLKNPAEISPAMVHEGSSDFSLTVPIWGKGGTGSEQFPDRVCLPQPPAKREEEALRRQEARKKREEKQKSKANAANGSANDRFVWFEKQRAVVREKKERESEVDFLERRCKGGNLSNNGVADMSFLVRSVNGFNGNQLNGVPHLMMPDLVGSDRNGFQPVLGVGGAGAGGFWPYQVAEKNSRHGVGGDNVKRLASSCSRGSSPGVSDYRSTSVHGGSSSEGGSHSSHSQLLDLTVTNTPTTSNTTQRQTSHDHSHPSAPQPNGFVTPNSLNGKAECSSSAYHSKRSKTRARPSKNPIRSRSPCPGADQSKPPKSPMQQGNEPVLLSQMPCVSATGNGRNGKTITGFLYRYTKSEVSIVCVCHGSSFSPAGFVEHAGGVDVENPLRHITVVPFAIS